MITSIAASWQNLPADILLLIAERSDSEIRHLRAVCSSWRSSLPLPYKPHHPQRSTKIPLPLFFKDQSSSSYLTLRERNIYYLEPLGNNLDSPQSCWIVKLEETSSGKMRFYNTLSHWSYSVPAVVDFLDCRVVLVGKEYDFRYNNCIFDVALSDDAMLCRFHPKKLGYFKFGDERWTMIVDEGKDKLSYNTSDIIYHKQKFYVIDVHGQIKIIVFDSSLKVEVFVSPVAYEEPYHGDWSFVQSDGDLFVVNKYKVGFNYPYDHIADESQIIRFNVYILNSDEQQWNEVTDLGDQSFFISSGGCAFSIGSDQFSGCGKNFIYCADWTAKGLRGIAEPGDNISIFSLEHNSSRPLHMISSRYSRLFWPIPSWMKQG